MRTAEVYSLFPEPTTTAPATTPVSEADNAAFDAFWAAYPKRTGKPLAKAKFMAIIKGGCETKTFEKDSNSYVTINLEGTSEEIVAGAKAYTRSLIDLNTYKRKIEDRFIPAAAVWLNRGGWMDF